MIRHNYKFIYLNPIIMLWYLQNMLPGNHTPVIQRIWLSENASAVVSANGNEVIIAGGIIVIGYSCGFSGIV